MSRLPRMFRPCLLDKRFEDRPHAGVQVEAPREVLLRLGILAPDGSRDTSVPVGRSVLRIELDRLVEVGDRPARIPFLSPGNAAVGVGLRVARVEADGSVEMRDCLSRLAHIQGLNPLIVRVIGLADPPSAMQRAMAAGSPITLLPIFTVRPALRTPCLRSR